MAGERDVWEVASLVTVLSQTTIMCSGYRFLPPPPYPVRLPGVMLGHDRQPPAPLKKCKRRCVEQLDRNKVGKPTFSSPSLLIGAGQTPVTGT